ncbi:MAG: hypothetical protein AB1758_37645 [Candidatus Eremiobacterota bacterium]
MLIVNIEFALQGLDQGLRVLRAEIGQSMVVRGTPTADVATEPTRQ